MKKRTYISCFTLFSLIVLFINCDKRNSGPANKSLNLISSYALDVPEPSGLSFSAGNTALYTVSDHTGYVYKISLQGKLFSTITCESTDLEGVTYDEENKNIWVVEERNRRLLKLDLQGNTLRQISLNISGNDDNKGLEGLTINPTNGHFYCVNEANPGLLIELDENLQIIKEITLSFANDYSGVYYDNSIDSLWIVSDEFSTVSKCDLLGKATETYRLGISKAEGIVVDSKNKLIYVVIDSVEKLYVFEY